MSSFSSLSFSKELVPGVLPAPASLLTSSIASRPVQQLSPSSQRGSRPRGESASSALGGVTSQRPGFFTVAQVLSAVLAEAHPASVGDSSSDPKMVAAAAAVVHSGVFELRVAEDDKTSVDPDFPPIDNRCARAQAVRASVRGVRSPRGSSQPLRSTAPASWPPCAPRPAPAAAAARHILPPTLISSHAPPSLPVRAASLSPLSAPRAFSCATRRRTSRFCCSSSLCAR